MKKMLSLILAIMLLSIMAIPAMATEIDATKFEFTVTLMDSNGNSLEGEYEYVGTQSGTIRNGGTIYLGDEDYIDILNLPEGTSYQVTEGESEGYTLSSSSNTTGTIMTDTVSHAQFENKKITFSSALPMTGGLGVSHIEGLGTSLVAIGVLMGVSMMLMDKNGRKVLNKRNNDD